ncbi:MAG: ABC transporter ATP-binding protein [Ornithinimicrobium sp.]
MSTALHAPAPADSRTEHVLECVEVTKRFGATTAVNEISLSLARGEALAIVGPSGCGKSTLLRMMAGLTSLDSGTITVGGREVAGPSTFVPAERRGVGIVFQDLALFPHLSVADNVAFGLTRRSTGRSTDRATGRSGRRWLRGRGAPAVGAGSGPAGQTQERVREMLELVGLSRFGDRFPHQLSGGEQQRVAIARALALNPDVVLLDEPFSQLDRGLAARVRDEAIQALRAAGASVVLVTHDQDEALAVGDRVAVLQSGRLVQLAEPEEVFHRPVNRFVSTFLGEADFLSGVRHGETVDTVLGRLPVFAGVDGDVDVMTRPHDLTVLPLPSGSAGHQPTNPGAAGTVQRLEFRGGDVLHHVSLDAGPSLRALTSHTHKMAVGQRVLIPPPEAHQLTAFDVSCPTHKTPPTHS